MEPRTCAICGNPVKRNRAYKWPKTCSRACANRSKNGGQEARFWSHVDRSGGPAACWPFTGTRIKQGYGRMVWNGRLTLAHRIAWEIEHGEPLPEGEKCLHSCDNPPCCNSAHLHLGSQAENVQEAYQRHRQGSRCALTQAEVNDILAMPGPMLDISFKTGISYATIQRIKSGNHYLARRLRHDEQ